METREEFVKDFGDWTKEEILNRVYDLLKEYNNKQQIIDETIEYIEMIDRNYIYKDKDTIKEYSKRILKKLKGGNNE